MQEIAVIAYANSKGLGEPAHPHSLIRIFAVRSNKLQIKGNLLPKNQCSKLVLGPSMHTETLALETLRMALSIVSCVVAHYGLIFF